jgi:hypothetical protein
MAEGALDAVAAGAADGPLNVENVSLRHRLRALCNQQLPHAEAWRDAWWEHLLFHCPAVVRQHESTLWHVLRMIHAHQRAQERGEMPVHHVAGPAFQAGQAQQVNELPERNHNINNNVANDFAALQNSFTQQGGYARNQDQSRGQIHMQMAGPAATRRWTWVYCWFPTP